MTGDHSEIDWDHDGWEWCLNLLRGGSVLLTYDSVRCWGIAEIWRDGEDRRSIPWPWPQTDTPHDPAEVIAMARRLAAEHLGP